MSIERELQAIFSGGYENDERLSKVPLKNGVSSESGEGSSRETNEEMAEVYEERALNRSNEDKSDLLRCRLEEMLQPPTKLERRSSSSECIFRLPPSLVGINDSAQKPEFVSIGPFYHGEEHLREFEGHKGLYLHNFLHTRRGLAGKDLSSYLDRMRSLEKRTRECYSDTIKMCSDDFVQMMLLDGCFVIELLVRFLPGGFSNNSNDPICTRPWLIPRVLKDLIKLENQLPAFVIESLYGGSISFLAQKVFNETTFSKSWRMNNISMTIHEKAKHLLEILYFSLVPSELVINMQELEQYRVSNHSMPSVTELCSARVKLKKPRNAYSFLDINFRNRVLQMPVIIINDITVTLLINFVALEQCRDFHYKYFTDYVSFMNGLIKQPRDVAFLCSAGIVFSYSLDDLYVANLFNNLGKNVAFNVGSCYLSKQIREIEVYYNGYWATMMRTYFRSPWTFISVFSAFIIIVFTIIQTIVTVLSYQK